MEWNNIEISAKQSNEAITEALVKLGTTSDRIEYETSKKEITVSLASEERCGDQST